PVRPDDLPNIDPRDVPFLRPAPERGPPPAQLQRRSGPASDFDPSYLYLPERNPGSRQPPCPCLPLGKWWVDASYFLGKTQNDTVPNLAVGNAGNVLYGNDRIDHPFRSGLRIETGLWVDRCQRWGFDGSFFYMESNRASFAAGSDGSNVIAQPFTQ